MKTNNLTTSAQFIRLFSGLLLAVSLAVFSPIVMADDDDDDDDDYRYRRGAHSYADVIEVEPQFRRVRVEVPRQECWEEEERYKEPKYHDDGLGSTIAGGLIGGVIGRQFGDGDGRDALTVVGAVLGSAIGSNRANRHEDYEREHVRVVERCETRREVREEERLDGYLVTYVYAGREYTTRTSRDPGDKIKVRVSVTPSQ